MAGVIDGLESRGDSAAAAAMRAGERDGAVPLRPGTWAPLEDGVEVYYFPSGGASYATGDYWQVTARTATGDVEWPADGARRPLMVPPPGITPYYAPPAWITGSGAQTDLRLLLPPSSAPVPAEARPRTSRGRGRAGGGRQRPAS